MAPKKEQQVARRDAAPDTGVQSAAADGVEGGQRRDAPSSPDEPLEAARREAAQSVEAARREVLRWGAVLDGMATHLGPAARPALRQELTKRYYAALEGLEVALVADTAVDAKAAT
jgi:hypothetical protein